MRPGGGVRLSTARLSTWLFSPLWTTVVLPSGAILQTFPSSPVPA
jgi:hypothetical protein